MENKVVAERSVPFFKIIYKNLLLIIIITALLTVGGTVYSLLKEKPVYTVTRSILFRANVAVEHTTGGGVTNDASLGKIYISQVEGIITSPQIVKKASYNYDQSSNSIRAGAIRINYKTGSLIFTMSYVDKSAELATAKLQALYETSKAEIANYIEADSVSLISTEDVPSVSVSNGTVRNIIVCFVGGVALGVVVALLRFALDNTVKDKAEFEETTGVSVIAKIEKEE